MAEESIQTLLLDDSMVLTEDIREWFPHLSQEMRARWSIVRSPQDVTLIHGKRDVSRNIGTCDYCRAAEVYLKIHRGRLWEEIGGQVSFLMGPEQRCNRKHWLRRQCNNFRLQQNGNCPLCVPEVVSNGVTITLSMQAMEERVTRFAEITEWDPVPERRSDIVLEQIQRICNSRTEEEVAARERIERGCESVIREEGPSAVIQMYLNAVEAAKTLDQTCLIPDSQRFSHSAEAFLNYTFLRTSMQGGFDLRLTPTEVDGSQSSRMARSLIMIEEMLQAREAITMRLISEAIELLTTVGRATGSVTRVVSSAECPGSIVTEAAKDNAALDNTEERERVSTFGPGDWYDPAGRNNDCDICQQKQKWLRKGDNFQCKIWLCAPLPYQPTGRTIDLTQEEEE